MMIAHTEMEVLDSNRENRESTDSSTRKNHLTVVMTSALRAQGLIKQM